MFIIFLVQNLRFFIILNIMSDKSPPFPERKNNNNNSNQRKKKMNFDLKTVLSVPS